VLLCTPTHRMFVPVLTTMLCALLLPALPLCAVAAFGLDPFNVLQKQHKQQVGLLMLLLEARWPVTPVQRFHRIQGQEERAGLVLQPTWHHVAAPLPSRWQRTEPL
jgi:hypothetical protein